MESERIILTKKESLKRIQGWNFMSSNGRVKPICLTLPQMTASELEVWGHRWGDADISGNCIPGMAVKRVYSEAEARELIEKYGSKVVNREVTIDPSALSRD